MQYRSRDIQKYTSTCICLKWCGSFPKLCCFTRNSKHHQRRNRHCIEENSLAAGDHRNMLRLPQWESLMHVAFSAKGRPLLSANRNPNFGCINNFYKFVTLWTCLCCGRSSQFLVWVHTLLLHYDSRSVEHSARHYVFLLLYDDSRSMEHSVKRYVFSNPQKGRIRRGVANWPYGCPVPHSLMAQVRPFITF